MTFVWAFQKRDSSSYDQPQMSSSSSLLHGDVARIFTVEVTNPRTGGAGKCKLCPQGASQDGYDSLPSRCIHRVTVPYLC